MSSEEINSYYIELEDGYNGSFFYAGTWKVKAREFGVLIPESARESDNEKTFYRSVKNLSKEDINFLLNQKQIELDDYVTKL